MGKNYKETRERLRRLLNKKKSKRRTCLVQSNVVEKKNNENPQVAPPAATIKPKEEHREQKKTNDESRILKNLLDFIEGTEAPHRNEKKAAKRARQKEKKQMLLLQLKREQEEKARQLEEERLRKEREALVLENLRKASSKKKKSKKKKQGGATTIDEASSQKKNAFSFSQTNSSNPGSQMVTIKRVMEPNDSEPTVTITLRGATPKQDKVLYTLFNGKVCESTACPKGAKSSPKDLRITKETERNPVRKLDPPKNPIFNPIMMNDKSSRGNFNYAQPPPPPPQTCPRPFKELTNPTSIQISNAVTSMSKNGYHDFNFEGIRLPPGITITKVDPCDAKIRPLPKNEQDTRNQVSLKPVPKVSKRTPTPEVIIVSTNKLKEESSTSCKPPKAESSSLPGPSSKKPKKKKNKTAALKPNIPSAYPGLDIEIIKSVDSQPADLCNQMSVLTINPYADNKGSEANPPVAQTTKKRRKKKKKKSNKPEGEIDAEDWNSLDNVFAPKDLDLNDGEIDDAERELEAFKLFCMQSVPLKRQEKVNLNLKDLVLKKKSVSCS